jgi:hypothetical protein
MLRVVFLVVELPAFLLLLSRAGGRPSAGEDSAVRAARARQEAVRTLDVRFKVVEVIPKGALTPPTPARSRPPTPVPPKDQTSEWVYRLVLDRDKVRIEIGHGGTSAPKGTFDGTTSKLYSSAWREGIPSNTSSIEKEPRRVFQLIMGNDMPITMAFRGVSSSMFGFTIDQLEPTGARMVITGSLCREYVPKRLDTSSPRYWLDTGKDYLLRRVLWHWKDSKNLRVAAQFDVQYRRDPTAGWVPASWITKGFRQNGGLHYTIMGEVLNLSINKPQAPEQFDLKFPPGTYVTDHRTDEKKEYFVQPDGSLGEIPKELIPPLVDRLSKPGKETKAPEGAAQGPWY